MNEEEVARLVQSMLASIQVEIAVVAAVDGTTATVYRQRQAVATRAFPAAVGLNLTAGDRVALLRPGGDLNAAIIAAKVSGQGLAAATATAAETADDSHAVDGIHLRISGGLLQWSQNGTIWYNA